MTFKGQTSRISLERALREKGRCESGFPVEAGEALFFLSTLTREHDKVLCAYLDASRGLKEKERLSSLFLGNDAPGFDEACQMMALLSQMPWSQREDLSWAAEEAGSWFLISGAKAKGSAEKVRGELELLEGAVSSRPLLEQCLSDQISPPERRRSLCRAILPEGFEPEAEAFAIRRSETGRGRYSQRLEGDVLSLCRALGEKEVEIFSASPLSPSQLDGLAKMFSAKFGMPAHVKQVPDPSLVGGFKARFGSEVVDMSAEAQIAAMAIAVRKKMASSIEI